MTKTISLIALMLISIGSYAQPTNDNPCTGITMPVIESADPCTPQQYNISGATYQNLVVPNACGNTNPDVWYTFTPTRNQIYITIAGSVQMQLYTATSCNGTFSQNTTLNCFNGGQISFGIDPGILYYLRISNTANNANFSFSACITSRYPAANQRVGINTSSPQYNFDVRGRAFFGDSTEFLRSAKFYSGVEINNAIKLSLPYAADNKVLASDATGNASWKDLNTIPGQWTTSGNNINNFNTGNVGIGTTNPLARLHVADSNVVFTGPVSLSNATSYSPPAQGAGSRMMWYPEKAAFRVGIVTGLQWNKDNIGKYSFATGYSTQANGDGAFASGIGTNASGANSTAIGSGTNASGYLSFAMGDFTTALGDVSTAMGSNSIASGIISTAMGNSTIASGDYSTAMGTGTIAKSIHSLVIGKYNNITATNRFFEIGNGTSDAARANAMTVLSSGNVGIGNTNPTKILEVAGPASSIPVTLVIGNKGGFGPAALELVSDYGTNSQWRPGYIRSNDAGGFTGSLEFYTNGTGSTNLYGNVKGFQIMNGMAFTATGTLGSFSDARLKNNITVFTDGLNVINKINPVQFYYNPDAPFKTDQQQTGIIAQELEKVAPYMVDKNKQNGYDDLRSVNNQAYTFLLINAVKELAKQNADLQKRIEELERKLSK